MVLYGTAHTVGNNVTTDDIADPATRGSGDPAEFAAACLAAVNPALAEQIGEGDILIAGESFGVGSAAEDAALALLAVGLVAVVAASADEAFVGAAAAVGLPVLVCAPAAAAISAGARLRIDLASGVIADRTANTRYNAAPAAPALIAMVKRSQMLAHMRRVVEDEGYDG